MQAGPEVEATSTLKTLGLQQNCIIKFKRNSLLDKALWVGLTAKDVRQLKLPLGDQIKFMQHLGIEDGAGSSSSGRSKGTKSKAQTPCVFFAQGRCRNGDGCEYKH